MQKNVLKEFLNGTETQIYSKIASISLFVSFLGFLANFLTQKKLYFQVIPDSLTETAFKLLHFFAISKKK